MRLMVTLSEERFQEIWRKATTYYLREDPTKSWTLGEKKRAVIWYLERNALK